MKNNFRRLIIILLILTVLIILIIIFNRSNNQLRLESFTDLKHKKEKKKYLDVKFPFKNIRDQDNNNTNVIGIVAPFRNDDHMNQYKDLKKKGFKFIGITSYLQFPGKVLNKYDPAMTDNMAEYIPMCFAWMYCFRNPCPTLCRKNLPIIQMAQSDFTCPDRIKPKDLPIKWDFIYICLKDNDKCDEGWNSINRSWDLAQKCFNVICFQFGLKGIVIGRTQCTVDPRLKDYITFKDQLGYWEFIKTINQCRFTFLPNTMDASPRTLTESLCLDKPVLVNKNIIGGWKYVNSKTGEFFSDENDIVNALEYLLKNYDNYSPREYFKNNYGPTICGPKLAKFISKNYPNFTKCTSAEPFCCD